MTYDFKWRQELVFFAATFLIYIGTAFVLTGESAPESWGDWGLVTVVSGARAAVGGVLPRLVAFASRLTSGALSVIRWCF